MDSHALYAVLAATALLVDCGGEGDATTKKPPTAGEALCSAIATAAEICAGATTPCDSALVADCSNIADILSPAFQQAVADCVKAGQTTPIQCFASAIGGLGPSAAQKTLAASFCKSCAFGVPGCEDVFFQSDPSKPSAGLAILPFSDAVVEAVTSECVNGPTCAATFVSCTEGVLAKHAMPVEIGKCVIESVANPPPASGSPGAPTCGGGTGGGSEGGGGSVGGGGAGGGSTGGGGAGAGGGSGGGTTTSSTSTSSSSGGGGQACGAQGDACGAMFPSCCAGLACVAGACQPGNGCDYASPNGCPTASSLGTVSGDYGGDVVQKLDVGSEWLTFHLAENLVLSHDLKFSVTLLSPQGTNYDLYVYAPCGVELESSTNPLPNDGVTVTFPDTLAVDDSREISIEVRYMSGASCDPWMLTVQGNP